MRHRRSDARRELLDLVEDLRQRVAKIDAYAYAAEEMFHQIPWTLAGKYRADLTRLAHFVSDTASAARFALADSRHQLEALMERSRRRTSAPR